MMRKKIMRYSAGCVLLTSCVLLSSCGLLPQEEEYRSAPVVREYESENYTYATVTREDVQLTKKISCVFSSAQESKLSFGISGQKLENVYVALGDSVTTGMVLAELNMGTLRNDYESVYDKLEESKMNQRHVEEKLELEKRRMKDAGETTSLTASSYQRQIKELIQEQELMEEKLAALQAKIDERQIIAPMDGTISYMKNDMENQLSAKGEGVIKMVSGEECYFVAEAKNAEGLEEGDTVTVTVGNSIYETVVEISEKAKAEEKVYFRLDSTVQQPEVGSKGSATYVLDETKDALCVPSKAVRRIGEDYVVYYVDENGVKNMKYIEIGLIGNNKTVVTSGLEFGESVILK